MAPRAASLLFVIEPSSPWGRSFHLYRSKDQFQTLLRLPWSAIFFLGLVPTADKAQGLFESILTTAAPHFTILIQLQCLLSPPRPNPMNSRELVNTLNAALGPSVNTCIFCELSLPGHLNYDSFLSLLLLLIPSQHYLRFYIATHNW